MCLFYKMSRNLCQLQWQNFVPSKISQYNCIQIWEEISSCQYSYRYVTYKVFARCALHPQPDKMVERYNQTLNWHPQKVIYERHLQMTLFLMAYRSAVHKNESDLAKLTWVRGSSSWYINVWVMPHSNSSQLENQMCKWIVFDGKGYKHWQKVNIVWHLQ